MYVTKLTTVRTGTPVSIGTENRESGVVRENTSFRVSYKYKPSEGTFDVSEDKT
jgi:hypothetical protein